MSVLVSQLPLALDIGPQPAFNIYPESNTERSEANAYLLPESVKGLFDDLDMNHPDGAGEATTVRPGIPEARTTVRPPGIQAEIVPLEGDGDRKPEDSPFI